MSTIETLVIHLTEAKPAGGYKLRLVFEDGKATAVDFGPFLRASRHPAIRRYLDKEVFGRFVVEDGQLHWNDFDLVFPLADLYAGKISD